MCDDSYDHGGPQPPPRSKRTSSSRPSSSRHDFNMVQLPPPRNMHDDDRMWQNVWSDIAHEENVRVDKLIDISVSDHEDESSRGDSPLDQAINALRSCEVRDEQSIALLQQDTRAYWFDTSRVNRHPELVALHRGSLLKPVCELDDPLIVSSLRELSREGDLMMRDYQRAHVYAAVSPANLMRITHDQVDILLPLSHDMRCALHSDFDRFFFVTSLRVGDYVRVEKDGAMYPGRINWRRSRDDDRGHFFRVDMIGMSPVYATAAELHKPLPFDQRSSNERIIPIRRVETGFESPASPSSFSKELRDWDGEACSVGMRGVTASDPPPAYSSARQESQWRGGPPNGYDEDCRRAGRQHPQHPQPSRSQSAHSMAQHDSTRTVTDVTATGGRRPGDRCRWETGGKAHNATIRFIGHLKGHSSLYAGIEFDEPVGQGTGMYQGEELLRTRPGHAGFVMLSQLLLASSPRSPSRMNGREWERRERERDVPPVPAYGEEDWLREQERERERERAVLARPNSDASQWSLQRRKHASTESLSDPPRALPEDHLIQSFGVGSCVEVTHLGATRSGVVRWTGEALSEVRDRLETCAVVELEEPAPSGWRSSAQCPAPSAVCGVVNGVLVPTRALRKDPRFNREPSPPTYIRRLLPQTPSNATSFAPPDNFGSMDSGVQMQKSDPWKAGEDLVGRMKGIQGHKNSCYLDATLYAMFLQSTAFDHLLERPREAADIPEYDELRTLLATHIVYPLRKFHYVRADHVMRLRELLARLLPGVAGLTSEEKDPEEILSALFTKLFKAKPFITLIGKDGKRDETWLCPLVVADWAGEAASTQHLLERSMRDAHVKFFSPPKQLILQLPRYGTQKLFSKILPLDKIDITSLVHDATVPCACCGKPATVTCPECYLCRQLLLSEISHCSNCFKKTHNAVDRLDHVGAAIAPTSGKPHHYRMTLSAVLCIETSHYVSFVKTISGKWLFFDSMADREGLSDGFNIPQVKECERMPWWLSMAGWEKVSLGEMKGKDEPDPLVNRLLSDSYICFYTLDSAPHSSSSNFLSNLLKSSPKDLLS